MVMNQHIEFTEINDKDKLHVVSVKKQIWNGNEFIPVTFYRIDGKLNSEQQHWLETQFTRGTRWEYSITGSFIFMDEQVYTWFRLKWGNK